MVRTPLNQFLVGEPTLLSPFPHQARAHGSHNQLQTRLTVSRHSSGISAMCQSCSFSFHQSLFIFVHDAHALIFVQCPCALCLTGHHVVPCAIDPYFVLGFVCDTAQPNPETFFVHLQISSLCLRLGDHLRQLTDGVLLKHGLPPSCSEQTIGRST